MDLWTSWWNVVIALRPAFSRTRPFFWFVVVLAAFSVRRDRAGVTSFVRALELHPRCYERLLHFFHSGAVEVEPLARLWLGAVVRWFPLHLVGGRPVLVLDGLKTPKEGRKMPAVKHLCQHSESNSKARFIMGHSFQAFGVLCRAGGYYFCVPVCARIHEGVVRSNRDRRTLIDKAAAMLASVCGDLDFILLADAYYANGKTIKALGRRGRDLVTRVRCTTKAYRPVADPGPPRRGRPRKYGRPVKLQSLFDQAPFEVLPSPVYGETEVDLAFHSTDLLWKPAGAMVRFVLVDHPVRGRMILLSTDLSLDARQIILLYSLRFKIEVCFRQSIHTVGSFGYHFWMASMRPLKRRDGNQHLHRQPPEYRRGVERKMRAYHLFVQSGFIAQGMLQYLAMTRTSSVWKHFGSWIRTIRPDVLPSEMIVAASLRNTLPDFSRCSIFGKSFRKFITSNSRLFAPDESKLAA